MTLTIMGPITQKKIEIAWLDVHTTQGSYVILDGHAPLTVQLIPNSVIKMGLNGTTESVIVANGLLQVDRHHAIIILDE